RSANGAEGIAVSHNSNMPFLYPILLDRVIPYFIGKDARNLDSLIDGVYIHDSNYKFQGLAFWLCVASVEFAILDMLGRIVEKPVGELLGGVVRDQVEVYMANNHRDRTAEETVERLMKSLEKCGARALKFKIGGRMRNNQDSIPGRTERLIPLARKVLGDDVIIYADSNGSYDVENSIRIGRLLEEADVKFFEEPCPFDHYDETKRIADALAIPIAGGEVESSLHQFKWMLRNNAVQIVQPDLFYFGGFIRSIRVAKMAALVNRPCTLHLSGSGLGYLYMLHFASCVPNIGPFQEFKGRTEKHLPMTCETSDLQCRDGRLHIPTGPGFGIEIDPDFVKKAERIVIS
ncbi:mandelate racemase/muconate lactonizing enzyme family protein, partial [candidate division KSB1 bacterium]|nr:mandelate racemase/muconate lactonizing enzyme family protein [candidate division KSB1 bacterium]